MSKIVYQKTIENFKFRTYNEKPRHDCYEVNQVHGIDIIQATDQMVDADGIFVLKSNFNKPLAIKTADCLPIAAIGKYGVALIHAGWKSLFLGILKSTNLKKLAPDFFIIGPHISFQNYEVGDDFKKNFMNSYSFKRVNGKTHFSLRDEASFQLKELFPKSKISCSNLCTFEETELNSYRRDKTEKRNWNLLMP